ncbi:MAG: glycosyltransferase family 1 protein [Candidatus Parcubacteria bacterium]|nr:glycosyltransferase family 1 protein [Candidatus Parcubacteria bacterium]
MQPNYSGVAEYTHNLLTHLFKIDKNNQYVLFYNSAQNISQNLPNFSGPNIKMAGFNYPNKLLNLGMRIFRYPKIDKLLNQVDIFFMPNLNFIALSKTCQPVITSHDLSYKLFPQFFSAKRRLWHQLIAPKTTLKNCAKIIAVSQNTKNDLINHYKIEPEKIKVIYSGLDQQFYHQIKKTDPHLKRIRDKYQLQQPFILFLGTLEPRKNIEGLIEAFEMAKHKNSKLDELNLVIAGERGWNYQHVFSLVFKSRYQDQIKFIGYIPRQDKPYLYNLAELLIFPSFYEGFGLPALEAQACGLPVIASANSSFPEILGQSACLIKPDHLEEISEAIQQILSTTELKNKLIALGLENVKRFSWHKTAQETLSYLTS